MSQGSGGYTNSDPHLNSHLPMAQDSREPTSSPSYSSRGAEEVVLPMGITEQLGELQYVDESSNPTGTSAEVNISAQIHKNFFMGEKFFTCYRRNYMACNCSFSLSPYFPGVSLQFSRGNQADPVKLYGFAMCLSAIVSEHHHQEVLILQHTTRRDKGPITLPGKQRAGPKIRHGQMTPPQLGGSFHHGHVVVQGQSTHYGDRWTPDGVQALPTEVAYDRMQFKSATANNGERRAGQQRYQLVVELWGNAASEPGREDWVKVAVQRSTDIVVRGRSPGHYQKDKSKSPGSGSGGTASSHGNPPANAGAGASDYHGGMPGGYQPNSTYTPGSYDHRGGSDIYSAVGGGHNRRDMLAAYSMEQHKACDHARDIPTSFANLAPYTDAGLYGHQQGVLQTMGVSPQDLHGKQLPPPQSQMRLGIDPRYNVSHPTNPAILLPPPTAACMPAAP
ncbi:NDT80 / PhoG like DNA-binding family protein [Cordyceps fumosorosea ARSEF 2679]|uniref:NDT80 / PhoG like DNA-binding family protein n=1 Tax=Cordyceps fumosorosea (strain ARSEF 2679) TaxID=1081104 RepID=A0A168AKU7_CORFA|nr:NDT80 / PhoG like DNA-binding family protein [Cordyceps fumosorosea ARSEF 2679]OAA68887.1 NDT80 / PhoG like DNA-binding family protein [Cordyceps fumosorosea ARSEF 2679]